MNFWQRFWPAVLFLPFILSGCTDNSSQVRNPAPTGNETAGVYTEIPQDQEVAVKDVVIEWSFNGEKWLASGTVPQCPDPLEVSLPAQPDRVTHILYPGQSRGGDYKPHGGFRFDDAATNQVEVRAVMDATVLRGSRYLEGGETQYMFEFINDCGIMYRFDHLLTLTPKFAAIADTFPQPVEGDSRTQQVSPALTVQKDEPVASEVGFRGVNAEKNVFFDFGLYDFRAPNKVSENPSWAAQHGKELDPYGLCWLDHLVIADQTLIRDLPAGDSQSGSTSDYCD